MKKLLIALTLSMLVLSGCGLFGKNRAWKEAQQENPLQVPPGLDRPSTSAALTIPPPSNAAPAADAQQAPASAPAANANPMQMHLDEDVTAAYARVGVALQQGGLGTVTAQDAAQHVYELSIDTAPELGSSKSFLQKHFSNLNQPQAETPSDDASDSALTAGQGKATTVTLSVSPAKSGSGSIVRARGDTKQAVHVISVLRGRLGG